jgi:23S rRNA (guanosine2251-2'-O)-methyltransferase
MLLSCHLFNHKALRSARQIEFLIKRHRSHETEWVRHHDSVEGSTIKRTFPLTILLDNVRSAFNVGSIFRTADACGCQEVITTGITPHPFGSGSDKVFKTSLGACRIVPTRHFTLTTSAIEALREEHGTNAICIMGMETTNKSICYTSMAYPQIGGGTVLILGNEVTGVDTEIMSRLDAVVEVPMFGQKNSLNVSACAPIVMYEVLRQWGAMEELDNQVSKSIKDSSDNSPDII